MEYQKIDHEGWKSQTRIKIARTRVGQATISLAGFVTRRLGAEPISDGFALMDLTPNECREAARTLLALASEIDNSR